MLDENKISPLVLVGIKEVAQTSRDFDDEHPRLRTFRRYLENQGVTDQQTHSPHLASPHETPAEKIRSHTPSSSDAPSLHLLPGKFLARALRSAGVYVTMIELNRGVPENTRESTTPSSSDQLSNDKQSLIAKSVEPAQSSKLAPDALGPPSSQEARESRLSKLIMRRSTRRRLDQLPTAVTSVAIPSHQGKGKTMCKQAAAEWTGAVPSGNNSLLSASGIDELPHVEPHTKPPPSVILGAPRSTGQGEPSIQPTHEISSPPEDRVEPDDADLTPAVLAFATTHLRAMVEFVQHHVKTLDLKSSWDNLGSSTALVLGHGLFYIHLYIAKF
ncbi:hypothetical protein M427DRAFT_32947 [Gonapodya prolifera JEL478]|uniref:Uncharacterized protein n=1 Tax=Gonapodya prolifera (strain JEL478) TaxID=1344416 RepID=A0A139ADS5_GONPJ|nr:hypothetical protein M427DRAFT_32947 [Gonapodya prolifera JEL478]|eukprot:KXS14744.1 hypothetical protein M427DRAFT_32947 [Gonapodya prolifera JEL478]